MTTNGGGWTQCFAHTTASYDSANWPSIAASRDKLLSKTWGQSRLHEAGTSQGSFCQEMPIVPNTTEIAGEVVTVSDNVSRWRAVFTLWESAFFTQVHTGSTTAALDCLVSNDGGSRLVYGNDTTPAYTWNGPAISA